MRKLILIFLILVLLGGIACAEEKTVPYQKNVSIPKLVNTVNNPVIEGESPLTGLPSSAEVYTPIMLPMDSSPEAYPLWGISEASILFQVPLKENGATRLLALFSDTYPEQAGGVRSGRMTMLPLARAFHAAFAYAGVPPIETGPVSVEEWLGEWSFRKPTRHYNLLGVHYKERIKSVKTPYNLSAHVNEIHAHLSERNVEFDVRPFLFTDDPLDRGDKATVISVQYYNHKNHSSISANSSSTFAWNPETGYIRSSKSGDMTDRTTGEAVPFANVIVMRVPVEWENGYAYYKNQMSGSGQADIFQSGRYIQGAWVHETHTDRIVFLDDSGNELTFQRGKTFIAVGEDMNISYIDK